MEEQEFDYDGAIVVVETAVDEIVLIHPSGGPPDAPASLPGNPCQPGESPRDGAVRITGEMTGLQVEIVRELVTFIQQGTPTGTMRAHGYLARPAGGTLLAVGPEGPVATYSVDALPAIIPVRVAIKRVLDVYLAQRES